MKVQYRGPLFFAVLMVMGLSGCVNIPAPVEQYAFARAAMNSAREVDAGRFAPVFYHRAMEAYTKGEVLYRQREFQDAHDLFEQARSDFERAENVAAIQRKKNGEAP